MTAESRQVLQKQILLMRFADSHLARFMGRYLPWFDFHPIPAGLILRELAACRSIIDVGCGTGRVLTRLRFLDSRLMLRDVRFVGLDSWRPSLLACRGLYDNLVLCAAPHLPIRTGSSDCVLSIDFLEHLSKTGAIQVLREFERIGGSALLLIPVGFSKKAEMEEGNPFQQHLSSWNPEELERKGYQVWGINGLRPFRKERCQFRASSILILPLLVSIAMVSQLLVYRLPQAAYHMLCLKQSSNRVNQGPSYTECRGIDE